jgi:xylitol oxidase
LGVAGPWHERLPHFRLDFTPSTGDELQSEYFVDRRDAVAALEALDPMRDRIAAVLQVCELRTIAADSLWLSMSCGRDSLAVHFTWVPDISRVAPVLAEVESRLAPFGARPHWGKVFSIEPADVASRVPRLADAVALAERFDPAGAFRNEFTDRYVRGR